MKATLLKKTLEPWPLLWTLGGRVGDEGSMLKGRCLLVLIVFWNLGTFRVGVVRPIRTYLCTQVRNEIGPRRRFQSSNGWNTRHEGKGLLDRRTWRLSVASMADGAASRSTYEGKRAGGKASRCTRKARGSRKASVHNAGTQDQLRGSCRRAIGPRLLAYIGPVPQVTPAGRCVVHRYPRHSRVARALCYRGIDVGYAVRVGTRGEAGPATLGLGVGQASCTTACARVGHSPPGTRPVRRT